MAQSSVAIYKQIMLEAIWDEFPSVPVAYPDERGVMCIGIRRPIDPRRPEIGGISEDESRLMLRNDLDDAEYLLREEWPFVFTLEPPRTAVFVDLTFEFGINRLYRKFAPAIELASERQFEGAVHFMLGTDWADESPLRARRLCTQLLTGEWPVRSDI